MSKPGTAPLGHSAFGKEKLEGPKKQHDDHGMDASVPGKGSGEAVPSGHWEKHYSLCDPSRNMKVTEGSDFNAKRSSERKTTHRMVNKEDH